MSGYHEPSRLERAKAAVKSAVVTAGRSIGELLLFAFVVAWSTFWLRTGWANYTQGHPIELVVVVGAAVVPLIGWYVWRTLGYLPVERPELDERLPSTTTT